MKSFKYIFILPWLFSFYLCDVSVEKKTKLLNDFINYYNSLPTKEFSICGGDILSLREIDETSYWVELSLNTSTGSNNPLKCVAKIKDCGETGVTLIDNYLNCKGEETPGSKEASSGELGDAHELRTPIKLENEVQADTGVTSGEQFIAIPKHQTVVPCVGCSSYVNPQASGVNDFANMGVRHLDLHEPTVKHSLESVLEVERQVQIVSGVKYIMTLLINFNNCTTTETEPCIFTKTCKVSILVKPWKTLPSGAKYRAVLANNCTEEWLFGDDGEILPEDNQHRNESSEQTIKVDRFKDVDASPNHEKTLSATEIKAIEDQIIDKFEKVKTTDQHTIPITETGDQETGYLSEDKKQAVDGIFGLLDLTTAKSENRHRRKRSINDHLNASLTTLDSVGEDTQHVNNPKYKKLAEESLSKYLEISTSQQQYQIIRIERVTVGTNADKSTKIEFVISPTDCFIKGNETSSPNCKLVNSEITIHCHSTILQQELLNNKKYSVNCKTKDHISRRNRQLLSVEHQNPGGNMISLDVNDPKYIKLAEESLRRYVHESSSPLSLVLTKIEKVLATKSSEGLLTRIDFIVSSEKKNDQFKCAVKVWDRSWLKKKGMKVFCHIDEPKYSQVTDNLEDPNQIDGIKEDNPHELGGIKEEPNEPKLKQTKKSLKRQIPGGMTEQNANDPKYLELAEESLQKYLSDNGNTRPHNIVRITKVSTQVVSGSLTRIDFVAKPTDNVGADEFRCYSEIWEQPWVNKKNIKVSCSVSKKRLRRQIPGGIQAQNPNDPKYVALAEESLQKYLSTIGNTRPHIVVQVDTVSTQVVSGSLTRIDFVAKPADAVDADELSCHSKIWEQPWVKKKNIEVSCSGNKTRLQRQIPGGIQAQNPNDPKYVALAEESLQKYLSTIRNTQPHIIVRVDTVSTQVVSGSLTRIDFVAKPTDNVGADEFHCHSEIWEQPWVNKKNIEVSCSVSKKRLLRQIPGGVQARNPNDQKYVALAEESLQKYLSTIGNTQPHIIVRVDTVSTQVVSGSLTRIDFVAKPADAVDADELSCHSKIWEQPWVKKKNIEVSCSGNKTRLQRQIPGGIQAQNPNDPKYVALAEESLQKYLSTIRNTQPHIIVRVDTVSTQVVSGSLTRIDFVAKPTDNVGADEFHCHSEIWEQPWVNKKNIEVSCSVSKKRLLRQIPGGIQARNPNDPKYVALAEESLQKYLSTIGNTQPHIIVRVDTVSTQVVSGSLTRIDFVAKPADAVDADELSCHSKIWEQPWVNKKNIEVSCSVSKKRLLRQIPGGIQARNPNDPKYVALAEESLQKYLSTIGNTQPHIIVRVDTVSTQVVSGSLTRIDFVAKPTNNEDADEFHCHSEIWEQPWVNKKSIEVSCSVNKKRLQRQIIGGIQAQNPNDPKYVALAEESLQKYLSTIGNTQPHIIVRVDTVSTQVVSGSLTRIDFVAKPTDNVGSDEFHCHSEIWEQPWVNKKNIEVSCSVSKKRLLRQIPGGIHAQSPNDPKYVALAEESLQKYLSTNGNTHPHIIVRVDKVSTQVVSGSLTRIDFVAKPSDYIGTGELSCHSEIWEKPWINNKEIKVSCTVSKKRSRREIGGGITEQNPNDLKYIALAEESLQKYFIDHSIRQHHRVVRLEKVSSQEAGTLTKIDFVVMSDRAVTDDEFSCHSKIRESSSNDGRREINVTCQVDYLEKDPDSPMYVQLAEESLQNYLNKMKIQRGYKVAKMVKVDTSNISNGTIKLDFFVTPVRNPNGDLHNCFSKIFTRSPPSKKKINVFCTFNPKKHKRSVAYEGIVRIDPNDPRFLKMAQTSLQEFLRNRNNKIPYKVIRVDKATTENIAGTWTRIYFLVAPVDNVTNLYRCFSTYYEHYLITSTQNNVSCLLDDDLQNRVVPDGFTEENPTDGKYIRLAELSLDKYLSGIGDKESHTTIRLNRALSSDMYTILNFHGLQTGDTNIILNCSSKIMNNNFKSSKVECSRNVIKASQKRELFFRNNMIQELQTKKGTETEEDVTNPEYKLLAAQALRKFSKRTGILYKLRNVARVTKRVVSGLMYVIKFSASPTECSSDVSKAHAFSCQERKNVTVYCKANVWDQPWIRKVKINVQCNTNEADMYQNLSPDKKYGDGKDSDATKDIEDLHINALAQEALEKYLVLTRRKYFHKITKIVSSSKSVTDGTNTNIVFLISPTICQRYIYMESFDDCALKKPRVQYKCNAKIIENPWIGANKDISINCQKLYSDEPKYETRQKRNPYLLDVNNIDEEKEEDKEEHEDIEDMHSRTISYYLHRAMQEINKQPDSNDTFKLELVHATQMNVRNETSANMTIQISNHEVHRLCNVEIYPSSDDSFMIKHISATCHDIDAVGSIGGLNKVKLIMLSLEEIERDPNVNYKIVHRGESKINLNMENDNVPIKLYFSFATTNCTKKVDSAKYKSSCSIDTTIPLKYCVSFLLRDTKTKIINNINVTCDADPTSPTKLFNAENKTVNVVRTPDKVNKQKIINLLTQKALRHVEAKYPQSNKIKIGRVITFKEVIAGTHYRIEFAVGHTNCTALSDQNVCKLLQDTSELCSVDVLLDKKEELPPSFQVDCALETGYRADHAQAKVLFHKFLVKYKPKYIHNEETRKSRFEIFKENIRKIHNFNVFERATATYGVTRFADLTYEEFSSRYTGLVKSMHRNAVKYLSMKEVDVPDAKIPERYDWREFGAVTDVKDQGHCRGSWAFSVAGNIESQIRIKTEDPLALSAQKLMDCDTFNDGCNGGLPEMAYRSLMEPDVNKCMFQNITTKFKITGGYKFSNESQMEKWLVQNGPISIGVNSAPLQFYMGGILDPKLILCNSNQQDHNVLIVGYGQEDHVFYNKTVPYWIIKNSWGKDWGEQGYYRLYRGKNTCGVSEMGTSAIVEI